jgi:hypothetical protein
MLKPIVQIVVFLLELIMLVAFGCYGYSKSADMPLRIAVMAVITQILSCFTEK